MADDVPLDLERLGIRSDPPEWTKDHAPSSATLTADALTAAFEKLRDARMTPHRHVVHPKSEGWTACADCLQPIYVEKNDDGSFRLGTG